MKKKKFKPFESLPDALILILVIFLVLSSVNFWKGMHNVDLVWNYIGVANQINEVGCSLPDGTILKVPSLDDVTDKGSDYQSRPLTDYYIIGMNQIEKYFIFAIIDTLVLGFLIGRRMKNGKD